MKQVTMEKSSHMFGGKENVRVLVQEGTTLADDDKIMIWVNGGNWYEMSITGPKNMNVKKTRAELTDSILKEIGEQVADTIRAKMEGLIVWEGE